MPVQCKNGLAIAVAFEIILITKELTIMLIVVQLSIDDGMDVVLIIVERLVSLWAEIDNGQSDMS